MTTAIAITTIKPTAGNFASFSPRTKEGEEKKPACFFSYDIPAAISNIAADDVRGFAIRAYAVAMDDLLKDAIKAGKDIITVPAIDALYATTGKEYLVTAKDIKAFCDTFAANAIAAAIAAKTGLSTDSVKVVKKTIQYVETLQAVAGRGMMLQDQIDNAARVLDLLTALPNCPEYAANIIEGLARKQQRLNDYLASGADDGEDEADF